MQNRDVARWSKMTKKYNAMAPRIEARVAKHYGDALAHDIAEKSRLEFEKVVPQMPEIPGRLNIFREIIELNAIVIAFYKALRSSGKTVDEATEIFYELEFCDTRGQVCSGTLTNEQREYKRPSQVVALRP